MSGIWWTYIILAVIIVGVYLACRPMSLHDYSGYFRRPRYVVVNQITGYVCYDERIFRTVKGAERARRKLEGYAAIGSDNYKVHRLG